MLASTKVKEMAKICSSDCHVWTYLWKYLKIRFSQKIFLLWQKKKLTWKMHRNGLHWN